MEERDSYILLLFFVAMTCFAVGMIIMHFIDLDKVKYFKAIIDNGCSNVIRNVPNLTNMAWK
jgi:hypothetical protein